MGMGPPARLPFVLCGCRLHQTEEKSRLHGCICSSKFLVAGDYCVKVRTTLGEASRSYACFCGYPPALNGILMVQNKTWGRASPCHLRHTSAYR